jgi:hypothetical protein
MITREEIIEALEEEIKSWGKTRPRTVEVPAAFLVDVLEMLRAEEDDGK